MTITQTTESKNSNTMKKAGLIKVLKYLRTNGVTVDQKTTDRHSQFRKHMRENKERYYTSVRYLVFLYQV